MSSQSQRDESSVVTSDSVVRSGASQKLASVLDVVRATETYLMVWDTLSVDSGGGSLPRLVIVHRATHEEHRGDSISSQTSEEARRSSSEEVCGTEVASALETQSVGSRWQSLRFYIVGVLTAVVIGLACWLARKYNLIGRIRTWLQKNQEL